MVPRIGEQLEVSSAAEFETWLAENGELAREIWVIIYKKSSGKQTVSEDALRETAMCHGWVDVLIKKVDEERYAVRFMPRRKGGGWSASSRAQASRLLAEGRMSEAGKAALPDDL